LNLLYPKIRLKWLPAMLGYCVFGTLMAGVYGILHDQITYSISPEYFTRVKFIQFHWADFGFPPRVFVAEIGFLATWWVGFAAAWFLARFTVPSLPPKHARQLILTGSLMIFASALTAATVGYFYGLFYDFNNVSAEWLDTAEVLRIQDVPSFVRVANIHLASYLGGLIGLIAASIYVQAVKSRNKLP
jgi:hypothetical protein